MCRGRGATDSWVAGRRGGGVAGRRGGRLAGRGGGVGWTNVFIEAVVVVERRVAFAEPVVYTCYC